MWSTISEGVTAAALKFGWQLIQRACRLGRRERTPFSKSDLEAITRGILDQLSRLDDEAAFLSGSQSHIQAQVEEEETSNFRIYQLKLLHLAKKIKPSDVVILKGEPGSGKSIALRQLARELLSRTKQTQKVPVYLNLREWHFDTSKRHEIEESFFSMDTDRLHYAK